MTGARSMVRPSPMHRSLPVLAYEYKSRSRGLDADERTREDSPPIAPFRNDFINQGYCVISVDVLECASLDEKSFVYDAGSPVSLGRLQI